MILHERALSDLHGDALEDEHPLFVACMNGVRDVKTDRMALNIPAYNWFCDAALRWMTAKARHTKRFS